MKRYIIVFFCFFTSGFYLHAQKLNGKITDEFDNPLSGVHILKKNASIHAHSNDLGLFSIEPIQHNDTLQISYMGFETLEIKVGEVSKFLTIKMTEKPFSLEEVVIRPKINAIEALTFIDTQVNPVSTSQEILRSVPGLVIGQHAGGGKAEQIFLRGFDIDHGTDINISVDGLPVNMTSHAHGQGYADLHFLIPETIENISFGKGPYYADQGNFNTSGYVSFHTKDRLNQSEIKLELGQFNTQRIMGMFNLFNTENHAAYIATEFNMTDGPFDTPQNFNRTNVMAKYTGLINSSDQLSVLISHLTSKWDASGQIPQRAVDQGQITRFGSIDDTEGGYTSRTNAATEYIKTISDHMAIKNNLYYSTYDFELYSNFTFFLNDPVYGDQIRQKEQRKLYGFSSELQNDFHAEKWDGAFQIGVGLRNDSNTDIELSHTYDRSITLENIMLGDIFETNYFTYINANFNIGKWSFQPALRYDFFKFNYNDQLMEPYETQSVSKGVFSPKFNLLYNHSPQLQGYFKSGMGFHSNDARTIVQNRTDEILPSAYGFDLGFIWKPIPKLFINTAYWYLFLEQEFVYVGDEGVVEPSGRSRRNGFDFSLRYQPVSWLFWDSDLNYTFAKAIDEPEGADYIPLAPDLTIMNGLNFIHPSGWYGGFKWRMVDDRPANEDNSIVAIGYHVIDFNMGYQWKKINIDLNIQNLFNTEWNETQFATETRLIDETESVEEIHFIPGTPFNAKLALSYKF